MLFVNLIEIFNKINSCPRKMGSLQVLCVLGDAHRKGVEWMSAHDIAGQTQTDLNNVRNAITQMVDQQLVEKRYIDTNGQLVESPTKKPVIRLIPDCFEALGGGYEAHV